MVEIKFRAWDEDARVMFYPNSLLLTGKRWSMFEHSTDKSKPSRIVHSCFVPANSLMQFTGLLDKNGVEIYEGDIVQNQAHANREVRRTEYGEYKLFIGKHSSRFYTGWMPGTTWEVIGNIYENKELIKEIKNETK